MQTILPVTGLQSCRFCFKRLILNDSCFCIENKLSSKQAIPTHNCLRKFVVKHHCRMQCIYICEYICNQYISEVRTTIELHGLSTPSFCPACHCQSLPLPPPSLLICQCLDLRVEQNFKLQHWNNWFFSRDLYFVSCFRDSSSEEVTSRALFLAQV